MVIPLIEKHQCREANYTKGAHTKFLARTSAVQFANVHHVNSFRGGSIGTMSAAELEDQGVRVFAKPALLRLNRLSCGRGHLKACIAVEVDELMAQSAGPALRKRLQLPPSKCKDGDGENDDMTGEAMGNEEANINTNTGY